MLLVHNRKKILFWLTFFILKIVLNYFSPYNELRLFQSTRRLSETCATFKRDSFLSLLSSYVPKISRTMLYSVFSLCLYFSSFCHCIVQETYIQLKQNISTYVFLNFQNLIFFQQSKVSNILEFFCAECPGGNIYYRIHML